MAGSGGAGAQADGSGGGAAGRNARELTQRAVSVPAVPGFLCDVDHAYVIKVCNNVSMPANDRNQPIRQGSSDSDYSLIEFMREYPDDAACLDRLWRDR